MARVTVEDCLKKVPNRFELAILVSKRVKRLQRGDKPLLDNIKNKNVVNALREVATGKVYFAENVNKQSDSDSLN